MTGKIPPKKSPARSHTVFENPNPDSTKADAHCAMESSDAPEHIMRVMPSQSNSKAENACVINPRMNIELSNKKFIHQIFFKAFEKHIG